MDDTEALAMIMQQDRKYWGSGWLCWLHCKANYDPSRGDLGHYLACKLRWNRNPQPTSGTTGLRQCVPIGVVEDNVPSQRDSIRNCDEPLTPGFMSHLSEDEWAHCYLLAKGYVRKQISEILHPDLSPLAAKARHFRVLRKIGQGPRRKPGKTPSPPQSPPK